MNKAVSALVALVAIGFSSAAPAAPTTGTVTSAKAITKSEIVVAQNADNNGVRDWGQGEGRDGHGQGKGQGKKGQ